MPPTLRDLFYMFSCDLRARLVIDALRALKVSLDLETGSCARASRQPSSSTTRRMIHKRLCITHGVKYMKETPSPGCQGRLEEESGINPVTSASGVARPDEPATTGIHAAQYPRRWQTDSRNGTEEIKKSAGIAGVCLSRGLNTPPLPVKRMKRRSGREGSDRFDSRSMCHRVGYQLLTSQHARASHYWQSSPINQSINESINHLWFA